MTSDTSKEIRSWIMHLASDQTFSSDYIKRRQPENSVGATRCQLSLDGRNVEFLISISIINFAV